MKRRKKAYFFNNPSAENPPSTYVFNVNVPLYECGLHPYFSFRYYDVKHSKFNAQNFKKDDFVYLLKRLHAMSQLKWKDILTTNKRFFKAHKVNWNDTSEKNGFANLPKTLKEAPVYQFEAFGECRILGFFNHHNVFKIVWFDRHHEIYPQK